MSEVRIASVQSPEFHNDVPRALKFLNAISERATVQNVHLLAFPEGFLQGYIVNKQQAREVAIDLSSQRFFELLKEFPVSGPMLVVGMIEVADGTLYNTAMVIKDQELIGRYRKRHLLPSEVAFAAGQELPIFEVQGLKFCINICFDTNFSIPELQSSGENVKLMVCCANNMLHHDTAEEYKSVHNSVRGQRCKETGQWLLSSDVTGERENHLALGPTAILNPNGDVVDQLPFGRADLLVFDLPNAI